MRPGLRQICAWCVSDGVPRRSLLVALVIGAILNLINQADALWTGARLDWVKIGLTFLVPYCVATYGAVSFRLRLSRADAPATPAEQHD